jgi:hypothetical protein
MPVPKLLLFPTTAPPKPPTTAPVPAPEAVLEGATPLEQPLKVRTPMIALPAIKRCTDGEKTEGYIENFRVEIKKGTLRVFRLAIY